MRKAPSFITEKSGKNPNPKRIKKHKMSAYGLKGESLAHRIFNQPILFYPILYVYENRRALFRKNVLTGFPGTQRII